LPAAFATAAATAGLPSGDAENGEVNGDNVAVVGVPDNGEFAVVNPSAAAVCPAIHRKQIRFYQL
jgi:hypothetical protein